MVDDNSVKFPQSIITKQRAIYDPPYESPLEDLLAYNIVKYLDAEVALHKQYEIDTICGLFRIDFLLEKNNFRVGLECDGAEFHDWNRDEWRDAMILGTNRIDFMYRLRGSDLYRHIEDVIYIISRNHKIFFSDRGLTNLEVLASKDAQQYRAENVLSHIWIPYRDQDGRLNENDSLIIDIRQRDLPSNVREMWQAYFQRAIQKPGLSLDDLIADYNEERKKNAIIIDDI